MEAIIENGIANNELLSIKVAVALPPYTDASKGYEWANGEVRIKGVVYTYVKKRICADGIEFLCLSNAGKTKLYQLQNHLIKQSADEEGTLPQKKGSSATKAGPFSPDYIVLSSCFLPLHILENGKAFFLFDHSFFSVEANNIWVPPPESNGFFIC